MQPTIYWISVPSSGRLAILSRPRGNEWLGDELSGMAQAGVDVIVSLLSIAESRELGLADESDLTRERGLTFLSFPIEDYGVPHTREAVFELVIKLNVWLSQGKTIGIHCRQGIGRSSLIAACLLSMASEDVDGAFRQIEVARGTRVPDTIEQRDWVRRFAAEFASPSINR